MARKQPTADQKAASQARRERFRELAKQVNDLPEEVKIEMVNRLGAVCTIEGRPLSFHNTCLVLSQAPTSTIVGGFRQWLDAGRCVRKGETGLGIWVPIAKKGKKDAETAAADGETDGDGAKPGFIMGIVFDVSQTEPTGKPANPSTADEPTGEPAPVGGLLFA